MAVVMEMSAAPATQTAANPRKRKKRVPAPGAAVDCFTCAERHLTCDRKRPFCSQCLDSGKDCAGYKTQLTWGVGVASRGKLRGLSLPVAGTERLPPGPSSKNKRRKESNTTQTYTLQSPSFIAPEQKVSSSGQPLLSPATTSPGTSPKSGESNGPSSAMMWDAVQSVPLGASKMPVGLGVVTQAHANEVSAISPMSQNERLQPPLPFQVNTWTPSELDASTGYPLASPALTIPTSGPDNRAESMYFDQMQTYHQSPALISPVQINFAQSIHDDTRIPQDGISMLLHAGQTMAISNEDNQQDVEEVYRPTDYDECAISDELTTFSTSGHVNFSFPMPAISNMCSVGKTSRMQYLINYYAEVISPVIVAFDGPSNPFRTHIIELAKSSETLQHAISALAASNLRQRRGIGLLSTGKTAPARRSSFAHVHLSNEYTQGMLSPEEQMREETLHKRLAVWQLNRQLAHPVLRKSDTILATLLILCLFHICDSGVAKFQTQFAGVRKLLALRGDDIKIGKDESRWMSRLFTWFDSLAATVNDREGQITGSFLDIPALCGDWSLENMAGIDSRLFKTIAKLDQLNMLKQGRSTMTTSQVSRPLTQVPSPSDFASTMDGNGWLPIHETEEHGQFDGGNSKQFWKEWQDIRHELSTWQLDTTLFDTVSKEAACLTVEQRVDLENISQSFRYSALLYLERLAFPNTPSSDESIQAWVRQSLTYIKRVQSDVYLLWPLFITGSECIDEESRDLIRGRCTDIQKDSGFVNNASCLQLLEKVWRFNSPDSSPRTDEDQVDGNYRSRSQRNGSAFMFRDVMVREAAGTEGEGEYIVV